MLLLTLVVVVPWVRSTRYLVLAIEYIIPVIPSTWSSTVLLLTGFITRRSTNSWLSTRGSDDGDDARRRLYTYHTSLRWNHRSHQMAPTLSVHVGPYDNLLTIIIGGEFCGGSNSLLHWPDLAFSCVKSLLSWITTFYWYWFSSDTPILKLNMAPKRAMMSVCVPISQESL